MTKKKLHQKLILYGIFILFFCLPYKSYAQTVIRQCISSYAYVSSTNSAVINQTAGQCFSTATKPEGINTVLQGFQQPVNFSIEDKSISLLNQLDLMVYPNPATYNINIRSKEKIEKLYIEITDMTGKIIQSERISDFKSHSISCGSWSNGIYLISVSDSNQKSKIIKLIISK